MLVSGGSLKLPSQPGTLCILMRGAAVQLNTVTLLVKCVVRNDVVLLVFCFVRLR